MLASTVMRDAQRTGLPVHSITPLGSLRRFAPSVGDVSLLALRAASGGCGPRPGALSDTHHRW
jgi:hypothetical protein